MKNYRFKIHTGEDQCTVREILADTVISAQKLMLAEMVINETAFERIELADMPAVLEHRHRPEDGPMPNFWPVVGVMDEVSEHGQDQNIVVSLPASTGDTDRFFRRDHPDGYSSRVRLTEDGVAFRRTEYFSEETGLIEGDEKLVRTDASAYDLQHEGYTEITAIVS